MTVEPPAAIVSVLAMNLKRGNVIVEFDGFGKRHRTVVAEPKRGCDRHHVHISTVSGKNWCYDRRFPVTVEQ
jgi:hypothetical protein